MSFITNLVNKIGNAISNNSNSFYGGYSSYGELANARDASKQKADTIEPTTTAVEVSEEEGDSIGKSLLKDSVNNGSTYSTDVYQFNHDEAQLARDWQEYMSNTSHQREVEDLKAAGLNPVLSANNGAAAYSASSASSSSSMDIAKLNAKTTLEAAKLNASSAANVAGIYANASKYSADKAYASDMVKSFMSALGLLK